MFGVCVGLPGSPDQRKSPKSAPKSALKSTLRNRGALRSAPESALEGALPLVFHTQRAQRVLSGALLGAQRFIGTEKNNIITLQQASWGAAKEFMLEEFLLQIPVFQ